MSNDIYSYIKENFGIEITDYQFKRDYIKEPLKKIYSNKRYKWELVNKNDLEYLYIKLNLSILNLSQLFNITRNMMQLWISNQKIHKDKKLVYQNISKTCLERYGKENYSYTSDFKNNIEKYNKKRKQSCLEKYGTIIPMQLKEIQKKHEQTCLKKYGVNSYSKTDNFKQFLIDNKNIINEKIKQTCLEKYGVECPGMVENFQNKRKQTCLEKYGSEYYSQSNEYKERKNEIVNKIINTKRIKNDFLGIYSKKENEIYELLIQKYSNTIRQYKSELYPFYCDFYIPELDLYIEYQGYWMHGKEPYIGSYEQKEKIKLWKSKNTYQYDKAIQTWTIRDPLKRETAKKNNLNWIEFFNIENFMIWYNQN